MLVVACPLLCDGLFYFSYIRLPLFQLCPLMHASAALELPALHSHLITEQMWYLNGSRTLLTLILDKDLEK